MGSGEKELTFTEIEVKFRVEGSLVYDFKRLVSNIPDLRQFLYIESDDIYYTKGDEFLRYRFSKNSSDSRSELTYKAKTAQKNNIIRKEVNLRVDPSDAGTVAAFVNCLGFIKNFTIHKIVHLYCFDDVTLPFYTVIDENGDHDHFIEIEVKEEIISSLTEDQAWEIISTWEKKLSSLGISPQKRLKKSLFEMYRK